MCWGPEAFLDVGFLGGHQLQDKLEQFEQGMHARSVKGPTQGQEQHPNRGLDAQGSEATGQLWFGVGFEVLCPCAKVSSPLQPSFWERVRLTPRRPPPPQLHPAPSHGSLMLRGQRFFSCGMIPRASWQWKLGLTGTWSVPARLATLSLPPRCALLPSHLPSHNTETQGLHFAPLHGPHLPTLPDPRVYHKR